MFVYLGTAGVLTTCLLSAGYLAYKATAATISFIDGFSYFWRLKSTEGNNMGLYETLFSTLFLVTSLVITITSLIGASDVWDAVEKREKAAATEGSSGVAVSTMDAMKLGMLGTVVAMGTWISAYSMGNTVDELIGWFDDWTDPAHNDASNEGRDKKDGDVDADGTSIEYDFLYHAITVVYTWFTFSAIMVGGQYFFLQYSAFEPVKNCDLSNVDESLYNGNSALYASIVDLATCKNVSKTIWMKADLNKDNLVSRCENAKALYGEGNSEKYSLNYSRILTLPDIYA